jgi:hypothetical protein
LPVEERLSQAALSLHRVQFFPNWHADPPEYPRFSSEIASAVYRALSTAPSWESVQQIAATISAAVYHAGPPGYSYEACRLRYAARDVERVRQAALAQDVFGAPFLPAQPEAFWLRWNDGCVGKIAQSIYDERRFQEIPILADALEDAGCDDEDILTHCRRPGRHVRGCWVIDLLLGKS